MMFTLLKNLALPESKFILYSAALTVVKFIFVHAIHLCPLTPSKQNVLFKILYNPLIMVLFQQNLASKKKKKLCDLNTGLERLFESSMLCQPGQYIMLKFNRKHIFL